MKQRVWSSKLTPEQRIRYISEQADLEYCKRILKDLESTNIEFDIRDVDILGMWEASKGLDEDKRIELCVLIWNIFAHARMIWNDPERVTEFFEFAKKVNSDISEEKLNKIVGV